MRSKLQTKDFWAGLFFIALGAFVNLRSLEYDLGSLQRMGPGFFPLMVGSALVLLGIAVMVKALVNGGESILGPIRPRALILVILAVVVFGALIRPAGLVCAVFAAVLLGGAAGPQFRLRSGLILAAVLTAGAVLVFVVGLGLPVRIWPV